jgi:hypothetical protein
LKLRFSVNLQKKQFNQRNEWNPTGEKLIAIKAIIDNLDNSGNQKFSFFPLA